jgi:predicted metal-dependent enzyme (double-stranded beta helix superfamily)
MRLSLSELERFAAELTCRPELWRHHVRHRDDARVYVLIWEDERVNAWIICWSEEQDTGFHDHDESGAGIAVIAGRVREERLRVDAPPRTRELGAGATISIPPVGIHRVLHTGGHPAVTIHAYSPPLVRTGAYRIGPDGVLQRELVPLEQELRPQPALS